MKIFIPRSCEELGEAADTAKPRPFKDFADSDAIVLLGDPGSGKTILFQNEAANCGGSYVTARNFLLLNKGDLEGTIIFIDGLDETGFYPDTADG